MRQRVAIAKTLAMDPQILLFDEPFGAVDPQTRLTLQTLVERVWLKSTPRKTVVFVTHDVDEALILGGRMLFLERGRIGDEFPLPFPRPRDEQTLLTSQACGLRKRCLRLFYESVVTKA